MVSQTCILLGNLEVQVLLSLILTQNLPFSFLSLELGMTRLLICLSLSLHHLSVLISDVISQSKLTGCHNADVLLGIFKEAKDMKFANLWFDCGDVFHSKRERTRTRCIFALIYGFYIARQNKEKHLRNTVKIFVTIYFLCLFMIC